MDASSTTSSYWSERNIFSTGIICAQLPRTPSRNACEAANASPQHTRALRARLPHRGSRQRAQQRWRCARARLVPPCALRRSTKAAHTLQWPAPSRHATTRGKCVDFLQAENDQDQATSSMLSVFTLLVCVRARACGYI